MNRILYISPGIFHFSCGGTMHSCGLAAKLADTIDLDLLCHSYGESWTRAAYLKNEYYPRLKEKARKVIDVDVSDITFLKILRRRRRIQKELRKIIESNDYEAIVIEFLALQYTYSLVKRLIGNKTKIIMVAHNVEFEVVDGFTLFCKNSLLKFIINIWKRGLKRYEEKCWKKVNQIWAISTNIGEYIRKCVGDDHKVVVVPPLIEFKKVKSLESVEIPSFNLLFLGAMWWFPNEDAVRWFIDKVFNRLLRIDGRYKFFIVGDRPSKAVKKYQSSNIVVTGWVHSVDEYIEKCDFLIVPIRLGSGIKIKILEGIKKGIPVLACDESIAGYDPRIFENGFRANHPDEFVESILTINQNPDLKKEHIANASTLLNEGLKTAERRFLDLVKR
jgi:polysaccharide biosynthesis protein PslH